MYILYLCDFFPEKSNARPEIYFAMNEVTAHSYFFFIILFHWHIKDIQCNKQYQLC